jgi:hypothetical protein
MIFFAGQCIEKERPIKKGLSTGQSFFFDLKRKVRVTAEP